MAMRCVDCSAEAFAAIAAGEENKRKNIATRQNKKILRGGICKIHLETRAA